jgi:hypothetical protein
MARKKDPKLRTVIRDVYSDLRISGPPTIPEIVASVSSRYPKLVEKEKARLFNETIASWARKILNSDSDSLRSAQLILPMDLHAIPLPVCIPVRPKKGETVYKETAIASYADLDAEIAFLETRVKESRHLSALKTLREYLAPHMAEKHRNDSIGPMLAKLAKKEAAAKEMAAG